MQSNISLARANLTPVFLPGMSPVKNFFSIKFPVSSTSVITLFFVSYKYLIFFFINLTPCDFYILLKIFMYL